MFWKGIFIFVIIDELMFGFFELPDDVIRILFADWLNVDLDLRSLDIALCHRKYRSSFMSLISGVHLIIKDRSFSRGVNSTARWRKISDWILLRGLRVKQLPLPGSESVIRDIVLPIFRNHSGLVQSVEMINADCARSINLQNLLFEALGMFSNLQVLRLHHIISCDKVISLCERLPNLRSLCLFCDNALSTRNLALDVPPLDTWYMLPQLPQLQSLSAVDYTATSSSIYNTHLVSYILDRSCNLQSVDLHGSWLESAAQETLFCSVLHRLEHVSLYDNADSLLFALHTKPGYKIGFNLPIGAGELPSTDLYDRIADACAGEHHFQSVNLRWEGDLAQSEFTWQRLSQLRASSIRLNRSHMTQPWEWEYLSAMPRVDKFTQTVSATSLRTLNKVLEDNPELPSTNVQQLHWRLNGIKDNVCNYTAMIPRMFANVTALTLSNVTLTDSVLIDLVLHLPHLNRFALHSFGDRSVTLSTITREQWQQRSCRFWTFDGLHALSMTGVFTMIDALGSRLSRLSIYGGNYEWRRLPQAKQFLQSRRVVFVPNDNGDLCAHREEHW